VVSKRELIKEYHICILGGIEHLDSQGKVSNGQKGTTPGPRHNTGQREGKTRETNFLKKEKFLSTNRRPWGPIYHPSNGLGKGKRGGG